MFNFEVVLGEVTDLKKSIVICSVIVMFVFTIGCGAKVTDEVEDTIVETVDTNNEDIDANDEFAETKNETESIVKEIFTKWEHFQYHFFSNEYISDTEQESSDRYVPLNEGTYSSIDDIIKELDNVVTEPIVTKYYDTYLSEEGMQFYKEENGILYRSTATSTGYEIHDAVNVIIENEDDKMISAFVIFPQETVDGDYQYFNYIILKKEDGRWKIDSIKNGSFYSYLP